MKKEIIVGVIVGIFVPTILALLSTSLGWLPKRSDYRIPTGTIAAFALSAPPDGWEIYEPARGRFIIGVGSTGGNSPKYALEQQGGLDAHKFMPDIVQLNVHGGFKGDGTSPYLLPGKEYSAVADGRPPFVSLLICRKK